MVHLDEGFDYLGFNVRRYRGGKLLITPSVEAVRRIRKRLADEMRSLRGSNAMAVIEAIVFEMTTAEPITCANAV